METDVQCMHPRQMEKHVREGDNIMVDGRRGTHKELEELENPLVREDVKCIPCDRVDDRQPVNFVFDEGVHCVKQAADRDSKQMGLQTGITVCVCVCVCVHWKVLFLNTMCHY